MHYVCMHKYSPCFSAHFLTSAPLLSPLSTTLLYPDASSASLFALHLVFSYPLGPKYHLDFSHQSAPLPSFFHLSPTKPHCCFLSPPLVANLPTGPADSLPKANQDCPLLFTPWPLSFCLHP